MKPRAVRLFLYLVAVLPLGAEPIGPVSRIRIDGLVRTQEYVVRRELLFSEGSVVSTDDIRESSIRLRNLLLFSEVEIEAVPRSDGTFTVDIRLVEKWTIIPIFKLGGGGGVNYLTIGAYDINILGRYIELGAQYERLGQTNSGVFWFRDPRFLGRRLRFGGDFWSLSRNRFLYDEEADLEGGYTHTRLRAHLFVDSEVNRLVTIGGGVDLTDDSYSDRDLERDARRENELQGFDLPAGERHISPYLTARLGRFEYDNYLLRGTQGDARLTVGKGLNGDSVDFLRGEASLRFFHLFPARWGNVGLQLAASQSSTDAPHHGFYLGGLDTVRGYFDGQFIAPAFWKANVEYRLVSIESEWFVLQHVFFADVGNIGDTVPDAVTTDEPLYVGFGAGIRLISPRVYRLNVRIDYGLTAGRRGPGGVSFGFQQFF